MSYAASGGVRIPFLLKSVLWLTERTATVKIDDVHNIHFLDRPMDKLVLPERQKKLLLGALEPLTSLATQNDLDRVGRLALHDATVILLHGAPGTGKTITTEYLSEHLKKPLMSIASGDLGATGDVIGSNLAVYLKLAQLWGAIFVIEDADVIFERRSTRDMIRNAIVTICLRTIENYSGVLLLTTTRIGTIDESFQARVQLAVEYRDPNRDDRRQIWNNVLDEASQSLHMNTDALREHLSELSKPRMNGKQIQSSLKLAIRAGGKGDSIQWDDMAIFLEAAANLTSYMDKVQGGSASKIAERMGNRVRDEVADQEIIKEAYSRHN